MSREIKVRAWSIKKRRYLDIDTLYCANGKVCGIVCDGIVYDTDDVVLEQDTGLKDKNGRMIREGDIVNLEYYEKPFGKKRWNKTYPHKGGKDINIVDFEDGYFKFYTGDKDGHGSELAFSDYGEWNTAGGAHKYVAEVIGNIHENPELLGGEE